MNFMNANPPLSVRRAAAASVQSFVLLRCACYTSTHVETGTGDLAHWRNETPLRFSAYPVGQVNENMTFRREDLYGDR